MNINDELHGFRVTRIVPLEELAAQGIEMEHLNTGLKLFWLKRDEENKTFGIAFTTLPYDDTGVFHILEHSVLGGSEKYPLREPFLELIKNSMNTFLNAMTFPDKTAYPVSSRNPQDFLNLVKVYLDAVFHPLILKNSCTFMQEGWHYEQDEEGNFIVNGVVYNEMKGAMASADERMESEMMKGLFPDSPYGYNYGGDPASIPSLTYEDYLASYHRFYSPSNAYVVLDGDLDIDAVLALMEDEYLCRETRGQRIRPDVFQKPVVSAREACYEITESEEAEGKTMLARGYVIGNALERKKLVGANIICEVLGGNNQSPLTRAVLSKNLAESVTLSVFDSILQPYALLNVRNCKEGDVEEIEKVVQETLAKIAEDGLDESLCEAVKANLEFRMRERDFGSIPQGLLLALQTLETWLYGGKPEDNLEVGTLFEELDMAYLNGLLKDIFLDNGHVCRVVLKPSYTIGEETRKAEKERMAALTSTWTEADRQDAIEKLNVLRSWQETPDSEEALNSLPKLSLTDVGKPEDFPYTVHEMEGLTVLDHPTVRDGIDHVILYFDASDLDGEELSDLSLLTGMLGQLSTANHSALEISRLSQSLMGRLNFAASVYAKKNSDDYEKKMVVSFSMLDQKKEAAFELVKEILTGTRFDETGLISQLIRQKVTDLNQTTVNAGQAIAVARVAARYSEASAASERIGGFSFYERIKAIKDVEECAARLAKLYRKLAVSSRLTLSIAGTDARPAARFFREGLPEGAPAAEKKAVGLLTKQNEGIVIGADVGFAVKGGLLDDRAKADNGITNLARRIVSFEYLWGAIRVKGGAYGSGCSIREDGLAVCHSYRDPGIANSLNTFTASGQFLKVFASEDRDYTGSIIGAVSDNSPLCTTRMKVILADQMYWTGNTYERRCRQDEQLLHADAEGLKDLADSLSTAMEHATFCVVGSREQVQACSCDVIREM